MKSPITTHVLDLASGAPASGVKASLEFRSGSSWKPMGAGTTDSDGRISQLLDVKAQFLPGSYRLTFQTGAYQQSLGRSTFHPRITIEFTVSDAQQHYHVPLLLSPFGYSTYRGS